MTGPQLSVAFFLQMFVILAVCRVVGTFARRVRSAAAVSVSGMLAPFALGTVLAIGLINVPGLFSEKATQFEAILFLGAAMSITAFPMLARIIYERGLTGTALGTLALAAGAIDDMAAWCVLAIVLASFGGGGLMAIKAIAGGIAYGVVVLTVGRRFLAHLGTAAERAGKLTPTMLAITLMCFTLGAWTTDAIGIHAVFGVFLLGAAMPRGLFT